MALTAKVVLTGLPMITAAAMFMQMLDSTVLNTALPTIAADMHRSPFSMQMAVISYTLTVALLIPVSGWLADRCGTKKVFMGAVFLFGLGSLLCALSPSLPALVAARIVQGVGGAMMVPVSRLALLRAYTPHDFVQVFNFVTIPGLIGPVVGPLLGGWLVTYASWHWIFLVNIPLCVLGLLVSVKKFPDFRQERGSFDLPGFLLIGAGVLLLTIGMEYTGGKTASLPLALSLMAGGFLCVAAYVRHGLRSPSPLISLKVFRIRTFAVGISGNMVARLGIGSIPFLVPLMLQVGLNYPADVAGMLLLAPAVGSIMAKTLVLRVLNRFGYRHTLMFFTISIGGVYMLMSLQQPGWSILLLVAQLFVQGLLMSGQFTSMNTITLGDLPRELASDGNSLLSVAQNLCLSFGVAISTALLRFFSLSGTELYSLHATFIAVGVMTMLSALVFRLLHAQDGAHMLSRAPQNGHMRGR